LGWWSLSWSGKELAKLKLDDLERTWFSSSICSDSTALGSFLPRLVLTIYPNPSSIIWRAKLFFELVNTCKAAEGGVGGLGAAVLKSGCWGLGPYFFRWSLSCGVLWFEKPSIFWAHLKQ
jgi:hypothetical protein